MIIHGILQLWPEIPVISTELTQFMDIYGIYNPIEIASYLNIINHMFSHYEPVLISMNLYRNFTTYNEITINHH